MMHDYPYTNLDRLIVNFTQLRHWGTTGSAVGHTVLLIWLTVFHPFLNAEAELWLMLQSYSEGTL